MIDFHLDFFLDFFPNLILNWEGHFALMVFLLAVAMDLFLGEPPARFHPVVLIGSVIAALRRRAKPTRIFGVGVAAFVVLSTAVAGHLLIAAGNSVIPVLGLFISAYLLKSTIAARCLLETSAEIGRLIVNEPSKAKEMLPALVSRNPDDLSPSQASSAVIESLSENYVDTVVSPLFYYVLFAPLGLGVEAALAYKATNTLDSMLGYRTEGLADLGWASANLDDLANWIPARLSLPIMAISMPQRASAIVKTALRDHGNPPSPNSGWPMAAAAGALDLRLEKPGVYAVGDGKKPTPAHIAPALRFVGASIGLAIVISAILLSI